MREGLRRATSPRPRASTSPRWRCTRSSASVPANAAVGGLRAGSTRAPRWCCKVADGTDFDVLGGQPALRWLQQAQGRRRRLGRRRRPGRAARPDDHARAAVRRPRSRTRPRRHQRQPELRRHRRPRWPRATRTRWRREGSPTGRPVGDPANAMLWAGDFACDDLAMSSADEDDAGPRPTRWSRKAGGVTPLTGLVMAMRPTGRCDVAAHFEDSDRPRKNLRPRAQLVVGEAPAAGARSPTPSS